ncbi:MAG TPA: FG-GAP-like repeat-containing protein [Bryobacteraceae bacterium]|nr:FG-GAP-like repeat-containing protein [Bryobacteraceae bacterium]
MNADGTNVRQVTFNPRNAPGATAQYEGEMHATISPDATMVAFVSNVNAAPDGGHSDQLYLVNADGSNLRQLTPYMLDRNNSNQGYVNGLAWSPDSSMLAFRGVVYTSQCGTAGGLPIWVNVIGTIKASGSNEQYLACDNNDGYMSSLDWSPDGTLIAWGRNVNHGAQGCSGCVGEPAIKFYDLSGRNRYSGGITSAKLGTDSCQDGPHCIHFSPDSTRLAYLNEYPNGTVCVPNCYISLIALDGTSRTDTTIPFGHDLWWAPGAALPPAGQLTLSATTPNVPPNPIEVWPGSPAQLVPTLNDSSGNLILHTAASYSSTSAYGNYNCTNIGPYGQVIYAASGNNNGTISAANEGLTSNAIPFKCWASSPCTFSLTSTVTVVPASGGTGTVGVTSDPGSNDSTCPWSATSNAPWITLTSGWSGSGNGSVTFTAAVLSGTTTARQGTITVAGLTYTVNQEQLAVKAVSGDGQSGPTGLPLPNPVVVLVADLAGNPVAGATVTFTGTNASVNPTSAQTDGRGHASAQVTLGVVPGAAKVTATVAGLAPVIFNFTAIQTVTALSIQKTWQAVSPGNPRRGENFTYSIKLTNTSSVPAQAVNVVDTPDSRTELSVQGPLTFNLGTLVAGASQTLNLSASASAAGVYRNSATVTWSDSTGTVSMASASASTTVDRQPGDFAATVSAPVPLNTGVEQVLADGSTVYVVNNPGDSLTILNCASGACTVSSTVSLGAGAQPIAAVKMDVDGDGINDVIVLNQGAGTLTTLLSSNPGVPQVSSVGAGAIGLAPFNAGDGVPRIAVVFSGTVMLFAWDGQQFQPGAVANIGASPYAVVSGDFNNDGAGDLLVSDGGSGIVQVLLGDGMGGLNLVNVVSVGTNAAALAAGDVNNDGALDAVVLTDAGLVSLLNDGTGNLAPQTAVPVTGTGAVVLADFNGDGNLDAAIANGSGSSVSFYSGDGSGNFSVAGSYLTGKGPISLTASDLDNDGIADLLCGDSGSQDLVILLFSTPFDAIASRLAQ